MKKTNRKYWIAKCVLDCFIVNIITICSASSIQPLKLTLGQTLPLSNNYETLISETQNVPAYKFDAFNDNAINDIPTDNNECSTNNTDSLDDDTKIIGNNETNIVDNVKKVYEGFNVSIDNMNKKDITNGNNVTTIYLAGYDDEIFQLKRDIEEKGEGTELLICFYLCKDLHYNDLGCVYTDIKKLQDVSWKYTHFFCVDNQYLKPTWCLDDVYATYNFPKRKESTDDKNQPLHNIKYRVNGIGKNENIKPVKSNVNYFKNALNHSKYYPNVHPKENYLHDDVNIDTVNQKFKERGLARKNVNTRYVNPHYCNKKDYYDIDTEETRNLFKNEEKQTNTSTPTPLQSTFCYNDIKADIDDANDLKFTIVHSTEPNTLLNVDNDENKDNKLDNFRQTETTFFEDSIPSIPETINDTSNDANVLQCDNYTTLPNKIATNENESNNTDCDLYNIHVSDNKMIDENLTSFKGNEADILGPPSVEVKMEDNPLNHRCLTDIDIHQPKLNTTPLTAVCNNNQPLSLFDSDLKNSYIASNLNGAEDSFGQPKYSVVKSPQNPSDSIKTQTTQLWNGMNSTKLPNEKYLNKKLETNVQNKLPNKISTNLPEMHSSINKQTNNLNPNVSWRINSSAACVMPYKYPVSYTRNNISLAQLPTIPSECNQRAEDSFRSKTKEKISLENNLGVKQNHYDEKKSPKQSHMLQKYENRLPKRQNLDLKGDLHKNDDVITSAIKNPTSVDHLYPATDKSVKVPSYNNITPLFEYYKSSKPQDTQLYVNNVSPNAHNTHMNDPIPCDDSYLIIQPNTNIVKKSFQNIFNKINNTTGIDSSTLSNFPKVPNLPNKPLVTPTYSKFKPKDILYPYSFDYGRDAYLLKTKQNLGTLTDIYSTSLFPYKYVTDPTLCTKQSLNTLQPRKIDSINPVLYSTSKKVNFLSEMSYDLPLAYERSNKISPYYSLPYFLNPITSVTSLLDIKSSQKTSVMYPKQNDSVLSQYGSPVLNLYLPKYLPFASYTKSLYNYIDVYVLYSKYKNLFTNSLVPKSLEGKIYPYYYVDPIIRNPNNFKNSLPAPVNNETGLVAPIPLPCPLTTDFSPNGFPAPNSCFPTLPNKDYSSEVFTFSTVPLPNSNIEQNKNNLSIPIKSIPVISRPILSPLDRGPMPIPAPIRSLPTYLDKDQRLKACPLRSSYPQTLSNQGVSSNRLPDLISFLPATPYTDLSSNAFPLPSKDAISLPMSLKKELGTNSLPMPASYVPISSWPMPSTSNHGQKLIPDTIKTSPILPKPDLSSPDFPNLPLPLPTTSLPITSLQPRTYNFPIPAHFVPIVLKPDNYLKEFPSATTSSPIVPKKDFSLKRFPAPVSLFPFNSNTASNSKGSVIPMSPFPVTTNKDEDFTTPISSLPITCGSISSALESKPEIVCPNYTIPQPLHNSLPISTNLDQSLNNVSPSISRWPISSILDRKQKTMPVPIQSLPVSSNLGVCLKYLQSPIPSLPISSPLETETKTLTYPALPSPSSNTVQTENHPNQQTPVSSLPFPPASAIRTKNFHHPIPSLPISSTVGIKPKYCSSHIPSIPISTNIDPSPKILTPIYSLPTLPNIDLHTKSVPLPVSYFPVSSNKENSLKGFSPTDPGRYYPFTPISELKPKVCPSPIQSFPTVPNKVSSSISLPLELNPGTPKPYQSLPFLSNINRCFNVFPIPSTSLPISPTREVTVNISSPILPLPSPNISRPNNFVTPFSYSPIPSTSEIATKRFPLSFKYLTPSGFEPNITPCIPSLPTSMYIEPGQNNLSSPCKSTPSTSGLNARPRVQYSPISSNLDVKPKSYTPSSPKMPTTSNLNLNSNGFQTPVSYLPNSSNNDLNLSDLGSTMSSWISPSTLDIKQKALPAPNPSVPLLPNYTSSTDIPTCITPLPSSSPLKITPNIYPAPTESTISVSTASPCFVSSWPKYSSPDLPVLKNSDICSKKPLIDSNVRLNPTLKEPHRIDKIQPTFAEIRDLRYPQQNARKLPKDYLQPFENFIPTPKSQVSFTNPNTYSSIFPNPFACKEINEKYSKASLKSPDTISYRPAPYSLISHPPFETMNSNSNTYEKTDQYHSNFELMPKAQVTILNDTVPDLFNPNNLQSQYPCKAAPKSTFTVRPQTTLPTYSFSPFESNQELEIMPPRNNTAQPYLDTFGQSSILHYKDKPTHSGSEVLGELKEMKLKPIPLPEGLNLRNLYPLFKPIKTPSVLIPPITEENKSNVTRKLQNEIQEYIVPNLSDIGKYPSYTNKLMFAPKFKPICSKFKLPSSSQTLLTKPSDYKEKLIKVSPYNKVPIQPSNEVLIPYLFVPCRKTPINLDTKNCGSIKYPQYIPKTIYNPIQGNLKRITDTEVPKSNNEIYDITDPKLTPEFTVINKSIEIPIRRIGIARYEPNNLIKINIKTNNPDIELKTWMSRIKLLKPKIVFDEDELTTLNFVPIVNNIGNYTPEMILDAVRKFVERHYGKPIVLRGTPSLYKYAFVNNLMDNSGDIVYLIWPTVCKCNKISC